MTCSTPCIQRVQVHAGGICAALNKIAKRKVNDVTDDHGKTVNRYKVWELYNVSFWKAFTIGAP